MSRIHNSCVSSEDIKIDTGADQIICERQIALGTMLCKKGRFIGYIDDLAIYIGDDVIIKEICIYNKPELSNKLTEKYRGKLLVFSDYTDHFGS